VARVECRALNGGNAAHSRSRGPQTAAQRGHVRRIVAECGDARVIEGPPVSVFVRGATAAPSLGVDGGSGFRVIGRVRRTLGRRAALAIREQSIVALQSQDKSPPCSNRARCRVRSGQSVGVAQFVRSQPNSLIIHTFPAWAGLGAARAPPSGAVWGSSLPHRSMETKSSSAGTPRTRRHPPTGSQRIGACTERRQHAVIDEI